MYPMISRRHLLQSSAAGLGYLAFAGMASFADQLANPAHPLAPKPTPLPAKAKHVILLSMVGAPSHVDTFDYKPLLNRDHGKAGKYGGTLLGSKWKFNQHGQSGLAISELFPELSKHADDLCLIRSMHSDQPVHATAQTQMHTGTAQFVRPSLGAWTLYGLGTENSDIPGFVALNPDLVRLGITEVHFLLPFTEAPPWAATVVVAVVVAIDRDVTLADLLFPT